MFGKKQAVFDAVLTDVMVGLGYERSWWTRDLLSAPWSRKQQADLMIDEVGAVSVFALVKKHIPGEYWVWGEVTLPSGKTRIIHRIYDTERKESFHVNH